MRWQHTTLHLVLACHNGKLGPLGLAVLRRKIKTPVDDNKKRAIQFPLHLENSALLASVGIPPESPSNQPICTKLVNTVPRAAVCPF